MWGWFLVRDPVQGVIHSGVSRPDTLRHGGNRGYRLALCMCVFSRHHGAEQLRVRAATSISERTSTAFYAKETGGITDMYVRYLVDIQEFFRKPPEH
jgi:hypothetical protein